MRPSLPRSAWILAFVLATVAAGVLAAGSQRAHGQTPPLSVSLNAPATCETDAAGWTVDTPEIEFDTVAIGWSVSGGTPPYEVLIDGKAFSGDSGFRPRIQTATVWLRVAAADPQP